MRADKQQEAIRRQYVVLRVRYSWTQQDVEAAARKVYPKFPRGQYWRMENGVDPGTPEQRRAVAKALRVRLTELPSLTTAG